jgi:CRISPR/Cas system endoribonuclease Cas6 (RAMP superfamily)
LNIKTRNKMKKYFDTDAQYTQFISSPDEEILKKIYKDLTDIRGFITFMTVEELKTEILKIQNLIWDFQDSKFEGTL